MKQSLNAASIFIILIQFLLTFLAYSSIFLDSFSSHSFFSSTQVMIKLIDSSPKKYKSLSLILEALNSGILASGAIETSNSDIPSNKNSSKKGQGRKKGISRRKSMNRTEDLTKYQKEEELKARELKDRDVMEIGSEEQLNKFDLSNFNEDDFLSFGIIHEGDCFKGDELFTIGNEGSETEKQDERSKFNAEMRDIFNDETWEDAKQVQCSDLKVSFLVHSERYDFSGISGISGPEKDKSLKPLRSGFSEPEYSLDEIIKLPELLQIHENSLPELSSPQVPVCELIESEFPITEIPINEYSIPEIPVPELPVSNFPVPTPTFPELQSLNNQNSQALLSNNRLHDVSVSSNQFYQQENREQQLKLNFFEQKNNYHSSPASPFSLEIFDCAESPLSFGVPPTSSLSSSATPTTSTAAAVPGATPTISTVAVAEAAAAEVIVKASTVTETVENLVSACDLIFKKNVSRELSQNQSGIPISPSMEDILIPEYHQTVNTHKRKRDFAFENSEVIDLQHQKQQRQEKEKYFFGKNFANTPNQEHFSSYWHWNPAYASAMSKQSAFRDNFVCVNENSQMAGFGGQRGFNTYNNGYYDGYTYNYHNNGYNFFSPYPSIYNNGLFNTAHPFCYVYPATYSPLYTYFFS